MRARRQEAPRVDGRDDLAPDQCTRTEDIKMRRTPKLRAANALSVIPPNTGAYPILDQLHVDDGHMPLLRERNGRCRRR